MKYFQVGDEVYVPKHKLIGTVTDKLYEVGNEELMLRIIPNNNLSNIAYGNTMRYFPIYVNYSTVRTLKTNELYQKKLIETENFGELNIPNLLTKKDITEGTIVKVVDNYMLERMCSYRPGSYLFRKLELSYLLNKEGVLTGKYITLPNGELSVECKIKFGNTYGLYSHSLQVIKKVNIFKRFWNKVKRIDQRVWLFIFLSVMISAVAITVGILKARGH